MMASPVPVETRLLESADAALMEDMLTVFGEAFGETTTYNDARPRRAWLERLLGGDHFIAIAALKGAEVVGGLAAYELVKFEQERSEIYVYDLAVAAPHRRQGIATALLEHLRSLAAARGAWIIFIQADQGDDPAIALYSRFGAPEPVVSFDIKPV